MKITLNGFATEVPDGCAVVALVPDPTGHAVAVNGVVVPRGGHGRSLTDGDVVEIVTAVAGG